MSNKTSETEKQFRANGGMIVTEGQEVNSRIKIEKVADNHCQGDEEYLFGDSFDPEVNSDIDPIELKKQLKAEQRRVKRWGVWGYVAFGKCRCCDSWKQLDSIWGFIGNDFIGSGYDDDLMQACLDHLNRYKKEFDNNEN